MNQACTGKKRRFSTSTLVIGSFLVSLFCGYHDASRVHCFQLPIGYWGHRFHGNHALRAKKEKAQPEYQGGRNEDQYQTGNVLTAEESMFKEAPCDGTSDRCTWPILIVEPHTFTFTNGADIHLPKSITSRAFEYGSTWVEHYYQPLIQECTKMHRLDIIRALYQWYTSQFTLDYLQEYAEISAEQFLYASFQLHDKTSFAEDLLYNDKQIDDQLKGCRRLMEEYTNTMTTALPPEIYAKIKKGTDSFFHTSVEQIAGADKHLSFEEYMRFRAINAGGIFGFTEQCYLLQWLCKNTEQQQLPLLASMPEDVLDVLADNVGLHVALLNDLYGLERDAQTGDLNIILTYSNRNSCDVEEAVEWAVQWMQQCAVNINAIEQEYPNTFPSKFRIAMSCVAGNHGGHETCKRYKLPDGFVWPDSCLVDTSFDVKGKKDKLLYWDILGESSGQTC